MFPLVKTTRECCRRNVFICRIIKILIHLVQNAEFILLLLDIVHIELTQGIQRLINEWTCFCKGVYLRITGGSVFVILNLEINCNRVIYYVTSVLLHF